MLDIITVPMVTLALGVFCGLFVIFAMIVISYTWYCFNRYEPVYIKTKTGDKKKNLIASQFCKLVLYAEINDQCLTNVESIGLWMLVSNIVSEWPDETILSIAEIHKKTAAELKDQLSQDNYEKISANMIRLELAVDSNFMSSGIQTPPFLRVSTYALWVSRTLSALNKI